MMVRHVMRMTAGYLAALMGFVLNGDDEARGEPSSQKAANPHPLFAHG